MDKKQVFKKIENDIKDIQLELETQNIILRKIIEKYFKENPGINYEIILKIAHEECKPIVKKIHSLDMKKMCFEITKNMIEEI